MDEQTAPTARGWDYRRGFEERSGRKLWQKLWHFAERCEEYPTRNFIVRIDRPNEDELCSRCQQAA